ncbi:MAG: response regulator [Planctomycetota bacterium]|nr:response regulator [Planctomycetota bacterium]
MSASRLKPHGLIWVGVAAALALAFAIDSALALGVTGSILYLPVIWLAFRCERPTAIYMTAGVCSFMVLVDLLISSPGGEPWKIAVNRTLGIAAIWMTAMLCAQVVYTRRKLAARDRYRGAIVETALDAVISMNARGCVVDWNAQAETTFGWTAGEAAGKELASLIIPEPHRAEHRAGLQHYLKTGDGPVLGQRLELTALRKSGEEFPIELSVIAVPLDDGVLFNAFLRDVSERTEDARYRTRMAALVDSSYDAIISKDIAGTIISWNVGAERVYGFTEEEAVGQTIAIILPPDVEEEEAEILRALQTGLRLEQFETVRRRKDGRLIPVSLTVSPIADNDATIIGSSTIERDISESKRQQEELQQAKEAAEEATRVRAEFLANVSHELRTPLNAIIGMTQITLDEEVTDDVRDYVQTADDAARSLLTLLNDILDFSKIESGKFTIDKEPFCLRETIDETVKTLSMRAFEEGIELACEIDPACPDNLIGDPIRLRQVLTNLIGNAIKFTDRGEVVLAVKASRKWRQETQLRFSVRDTGVGVPAEDQRRILEPFTQVDASSTRRYGGTGLGLAICTELIQLMGGRMSVESEAGSGSCFSFQLSFARQKDPNKQSGDFTPLEQLRNMRVLVVDDNETNRRIISEAFSNWSMRPDTANDGEQALGRLEQARKAGSPYPLVIVDALMPGMDGYTLSEEIAERLPDPPPVILMLSSSDRHEFRQREEAAGVSVYLQKPVSQSDLMDAVMRAMNVQVVADVDPGSDSPHARMNDSLSVLLAEDTPANQKVVTTILKKRGHAVTVAQNGREAVELFGKQAFDVVLMDVQMPIMDGIQLTAAIREHENASAKSTPIIAMTAHAMTGDREKYLEAGMDAYISKPIDVNVLIELVESFSNESLPAGGDAPSIETRNVSEVSASTVIDFDGAMKRLAGDKDLFRDFIGYFDEDSPKLLATLREAITDGDAPTVERAAHSLKGLAANFGAEACVAAAHELEERGKHHDLANTSELLHGLEEEVRRLGEALRAYRK